MIFVNRTKRKGSKSKKKSNHVEDVYNTPTKRSSRSASFIPTSLSMASLGTGELDLDGGVSFIPSPEGKRKSGISSFFTTGDQNTSAITSSILSSVKSRIIKDIGRCTAFLRVSDLTMDDESLATMSVTSESTHDQQDFCHYPSVNPPPGFEIDPKERWVALCTTFDDTDCNGTSDRSSHTPIAPLAIGRLANFGLTTTLNEEMWQPDSKSDKLLKKASSDNEWMTQTFSKGRKEASVGPNSSKDILVWTGSFNHGLHGSEVPAIRSAAIMETSAKKLMELMVDSTRVKEYNKMSLGRTDLVTFSGNIEEVGPFGKSITKVMKSVSKPPMVSKVELTSILHAKELSDGTGYLIVSRAVHRPEEESLVAASMKAEIVMGVNLIVDFETGSDEKERCLMINVNHMRSPMVPMYVARKLAVTSAHKFINDVRAAV